jgi:type VI secretion system protein ImpJ
MQDTQAVYWHQGMFLQPQHFQVTDMHGMFQHKPMREAGLPYFWGVGELELVASAALNRNFEIQSAKLIFPDQTYIEYPGNCRIKPRPFAADWVEGDKPFSVYLGLKKLSSTDSNVTVVADMVEADAATTRYVSLSSPTGVADLYSSGPSAQVRSLTHVVKIFFESEIDRIQDFTLIPIARLVREGEGVKLSENFVPPCYTLSGSGVLFRLIKDLRDELTGRARQLQEYKSPNEMRKADFDASYMIFLLALRSLNRASPYLFHLTETKQVHPWLAYGILRQLIGDLSSFSERFNMLGETDDGLPGLPSYDHSDLARCFGRARTMVSQLLNEITVGPEFLTVLAYVDGYYIGQLPRNFFGQRNRFYLVLRTERTVEWVVDSVQRDVRLAAKNEMAGLISHALPGLELIHMAVAPQGLPRRSYSYYFRIEQISQQWEIVEREGEIALYWMEAPEDLKAEIVVLRS